MFDSKIVNTILNQNFQSGLNSIKLDIKNLASGTYFIRLRSNSEIMSGHFVKE